MVFIYRQASLVRCSLVSYRCLRYCWSRVTDVRLGIVYDGKRLIRVVDGTEIDPRVYNARDYLVYCDYIQNHQRIFSYPKRVHALRSYFSNTEKKVEAREKGPIQPSTSLLLSNLYREEKRDNVLNLCAKKSAQGKFTDQSWNMLHYSTQRPTQGCIGNDSNSRCTLAYKKYMWRNRSMLEKRGIHFKDYLDDKENDIPWDWMRDYEQFNDSLIRDDTLDLYGTSVPELEISRVPCRGCGALLHCQDHTTPGYLPSEIFIGQSEKELKNVVCQRCHFLKKYNTALDVRVSPKEYGRMLMNLRDIPCAIILIVDMTDIPCSIWADCHRILHPESKVFVLGNKIDLFPVDGPTSLGDLSDLLRQTVISRTSIKDSQIADVSLVSAKTGFGIETFIDSLLHAWNCKGNTYLVGCTNVGKSSIFNSLIHSDYCAAAGQDIIQSATVSSWPGTTLNLLKFPVHCIDSATYRERSRRIAEEKKSLQTQRDAKGELFRLHKDTRFATLEGSVGKTFVLAKHGMHKTGRRQPFKEEDFSWCHDTPGTLNEEQILDLLTIDELKALKPKQIIQPRSFTLKSEQSVFVAGLGRVDLLSKSDICCTLFSSYQLPITICYTRFADEIYRKLLGTEAFVVPINDPERLKVWPELRCKYLETEGIGVRQSAADIVLSSAAWMAVTGDVNVKLEFNVWTPFGRGIHLRRPAYLSKSVAYRGRRLSGTPMYKEGKQMYFMKELGG